jgi:hypothetical protein
VYFTCACRAEMRSARMRKSSRDWTTSRGPGLDHRDGRSLGDAAGDEPAGHGARSRSVPLCVSVSLW